MAQGTGGLNSGCREAKEINSHSIQPSFREELHSLKHLKPNPSLQKLAEWGLRQIIWRQDWTQLIMENHHFQGEKTPLCYLARCFEGKRPVMFLTVHSHTCAFKHIWSRSRRTAKPPADQPYVRTWWHHGSAPQECPAGRWAQGQERETDLWRSGSVCWGPWSLGSHARWQPPLGTGTTCWVVCPSAGPAHLWSAEKCHRAPFYPDVSVRCVLKAHHLVSQCNTTLTSLCPCA